MADYWTKDPDAVLDWHFDWINWLDQGEVITTSTFDVTAGIAVNATENTTSNTTVWLAGGRAGQNYQVTNRIITSAARTDERSIIIRVRDR